MKMIIFLLLCAFTGQALCGAFPDWDKLSAKFLKYSSLPMNESDAMEKGWHFYGDGCQNSTFFLGKRYILNNDPSTMMLYDSNGHVSGLQMGFSNKNEVQRNQIGHAIIDDGENYLVTMYFTDPKNVCNGKPRDTKHVGEKLFFATGNNTMMEIPLREKDLKGTKWVKGKCFLGMGKHYWYNISPELNCDDFFPYFLLFHRGTLVGCGFATQANIESSRVEHPPKKALWLFMKQDTIPKCLPKVNYLTTQHVFLDKMPHRNYC